MNMFTFSNSVEGLNGLNLSFFKDEDRGVTSKRLRHLKTMKSAVNEIFITLFLSTSNYQPDGGLKTGPRGLILWEHAHHT